MRDLRPGRRCARLLCPLVLASLAALSPPRPLRAQEAPSAPTPPLGARAPAVPVSVRAEWGKGVTFRAGDLFSLQLRSRIQFLAGISLPTGGAVAAGAADHLSTDLAIRRLRLSFSGHAFTPRLRYTIQLGMAPRDMEPDLLIPVRDAYVTWQPLRDLGIRFGQMKVPYGKQRIVSSSALQLVDRSVATAALNLDRDMGVYLLSEDFLGLGGRLQYQAGVFGGRGRNRSPGTDGVMYAARIQINPMGPFDDLAESDHERRASPRLSIGGSVAQNFNSNRGRSTHGDVYKFARFTYLHAGADLHFKWRGLSVLSEFFYRGVDKTSEVSPTDGVTREYSRPALGYFVQAGFLFPLPFEVVGRYGEIRPLGAEDPAFHQEREVGGGLSYYVYEHSLKLQADYFYLSTEDPRSPRHQARLQVQLYF